MNNSFEKPFIKKFTNNTYFYIYDVNTNRIIKVDKPLYDIIDDYNQDNPLETIEKYKNTHPIDQLKKSVLQIQQSQENHNLLSSSRPKQITTGINHIDHIKRIEKEGLGQMILEVTGNCNLNCQYCQVAGRYARPESRSLSMNRDIWKRALDFFGSRTQNSEAPHISFYGGEPILRFELIRDTVDYVIKNFHPGKYSFGMTTNGTLLDDAKADFFAKNDFYIRISLDGPQEIHDRYRVTTEGKPSFQIIMNNLKRLKQRHPDFFSKKVSITLVLAPPYDIDKLFHFFINDSILSQVYNNGKIRVGLLDTRESNFLDDFQMEERMKEYKQVFTNLVGRLKQLILNNQLEKVTLEKQTILNILRNLAQRPIKKLTDYFPPIGACHPGMRRVFVSTGGQFYICERDCRAYPLGDVYNGFDYEQILQYYRKLDEVMEDCKNCWALTYCDRCWASVGKLDHFKNERKKEFCDIRKKIILTAFETYAELLETNPKSLSVFSVAQERGEPKAI